MTGAEDAARAAMTAHDERVAQNEAAWSAGHDQFHMPYPVSGIAPSIVRDLLEERQPLTVRSARELEALPLGTVILTDEGGVWQSTRHERRALGIVWFEPGHSGLGASAGDLSLPARVLHIPG